MSELAVLSECDRIYLPLTQEVSEDFPFFMPFYERKKDMKHKKITALLFAAALGLIFLTACTKQSEHKEAPTTAAESSAVRSEAEKDCCHHEESCCKEEEGSDIPDCCGD